MSEIDTTFSAGETKLLTSILRNCDGQINSDWDRVAKEMGYKDASIAKTRWGQIKKKKILVEGTGTVTPSLTKAAKPKSPKKPAKRKANDHVDSGNEKVNDDDEEKVAKKAKVEEVKEEDSDE